MKRNEDLQIGDPVIIKDGPGGWIVGLDDTYCVVASMVFNFQVLRTQVVYDNTRSRIVVRP